MRVRVSCFALLVACAAFGQSITATKAYVDRKYTEVTNKLAKMDASVKLHAITPEVTDTTVTLKPVDGAANWVKGTVAAGSSGKRTFRIVARYDVFYMDYEHEEDLTVKWEFEFSDKNSEIVSILNGADPTLKIRLTDEVTGAVTESDPPYTSNGEHPLNLLKDSILEFFMEGIELSEGEFDWESTDLSSESFSAQIYGSSLFDRYEHIFPTFIAAGGHAYSMDSGGTSESSYAEHTAPKTSAAAFSISLPDSTGPARHVSLALTTDVTAETAVTWEGADEIIEAFPGASKLVPGLNVWDVAEVAPGKFKVESSASAEQVKRLPTHETVTNVARAVGNSFWDEKNEVLWRMEFRDGEPMFVPVTNENVKATGGVL